MDIKFQFKSLFKGFMKLVGILFAIYGFFVVFYIGGEILFDGCPSNVRCKGIEAEMQSNISGTRAYGEIIRKSKGSLSGFCENEDINMFIVDISEKFIVECRDTVDSYTMMAWNPKKPENDGWCADGKGHMVSTKLRTQNGVECK